MLSNLYKKDVAELYNTPIVQQTAFWSVVKKKLGLNTIALNFKSSGRSLYNNLSSDDVINSDLLVIIQQINKTDSIAYVPYGPELEPAPELQGSFLEELSESLRQYLPKNCIMIRYDLCWESYWAKEDSFYDCEGNWLGEPPEYSQEIRFNYNTCNRNFRKAYTNILPSNTIFLNLRPDTSTILDRMKPKTRYNIHLSHRKGVNVKRANIESLDIWYNLYKETALRNKIHLNEIKYFEALLTAKADNTKSPAEVQLLIAEQDKVPLASMFLIVSGNRGAYLYGASSSTNRNLMAPYALQWEAIKISKEKGCTEYDMFGVAPNADSSHPLYGLYKFKTGFGGNIFHSLGCWDYPFDEEKYDYFRSSEITSQGFHLHS
jgi:lipid II:glycine glycyltransferase (peptidoglycan interpeptide bridge formation enzyme)